MGATRRPDENGRQGGPPPSASMVTGAVGERSALPAILGLSLSGTRIMVGASLLAALMISVISAAGSAPRERS